MDPVNTYSISNVTGVIEKFRDNLPLSNYDYKMANFQIEEKNKTISLHNTKTHMWMKLTNTLIIAYDPFGVEQREQLQSVTG